MITQTDLEQVKDTAILFLHLEPTPVGQFGNLFVSHPYMNTSCAFLNDTKEMFNIFEDEEKFTKWKKEIEARIKASKNVKSIFLGITVPYKLVFFKYVNDLLSDEDYAEMLKYCYTETEFTSNNVNVSKSEMLKYFKKARKYIMSEKELKKYNTLSEQVEIFRGVGDTCYMYGFSWTLNQKKAEWFANRFNYESHHVYKCVINKSDIIAYFSNRDEDEVIIDINKLKNYEICELECIS